ncbi:MAG: bifunctional protein-serine/threonine kinase/phosphatase [Chthoniobacteraceae bacterium]
MKVRMTTHGLARAGKPASEDSFAGRAWGGSVVAALSDGVGSAQAAREASGRIVNSLIHHYVARPRSWSPRRALDEFTQRINQNLHAESLNRYQAPEMVATLAAAVLEEGHLYGINVGDSRVYLWRDETLEQLSHDHVLHHVPHALGQAVGLAPELEPHHFEARLHTADLLLLCSDGVSNHLDEETLKSLLRQRPSARTLVQAAREKATTETDDDMSAIIIDVLDASVESFTAQPKLVPPQLHKGEEIDGYLLQRSFQNDDRVWLATKEGARFILKFAPREAAGSEEHARLFQREVFNAVRMSGRFFPAARVPVDSQWNYYVMEFVEAPPLNIVLKQRALAVEEAVALAIFLCQAGQELAGLGLIHGDVKPENLLAFKDGDALEFKLLDLGTAMEIFTIHPRAGTASYLAPERFGDAPATERTEIFALGVTLYEALTRRLPYGEIERFQTPHFRPPHRTTHWNPHVPPWLDAVIMRALSITPEARYNGFSELLFDLQHPEAVEPFHFRGRSASGALVFYRAGFYLLLAILLTIFLCHLL